jgi:hypothetical protein
MKTVLVTLDFVSLRLLEHQKMRVSLRSCFRTVDVERKVTVMMWRGDAGIPVVARSGPPLHSLLGIAFWVSGPAHRCHS